MCFSNQMTIIQGKLMFLHEKYLRYYPDQYHTFYTLQPCNKTSNDFVQ